MACSNTEPVSKWAWDTPAIRQENLHKAVTCDGRTNRSASELYLPLAVNFLRERIALDMQNVDGMLIGHVLEVGVRKPNPCRERSGERLRGIGGVSGHNNLSVHRSIPNKYTAGGTETLPFPPYVAPRGERVERLCLGG